MKRLCHITVLMACCLVFASCDEELSSITGPTPNLEPTLSSIQANIFNMSDSSGRLACIGCHTDQGRSSRRSGTGSAGRPLVSATGRASQRRQAGRHAGDSGRCRQNSYMIRKLEGRDIAGERMPRGNGPFLTEGQIIVIRKWISDGAANN